MTPLDNSGIININGRSCAVGFSPSATYEYVPGDQELIVTDTSSVPDGDDIKVIHVRVSDATGAVKYGKIEAAEGNVTVDVSTLDATDGLTVNVTFVTDNRLTADGSVYNIGTTAPDEGNIRYVNKVINC